MCKSYKPVGSTPVGQMMSAKICSLIVCLAFPLVASGELFMSTARQSAEKSLVFTSFYQETSGQKFRLKVSGAGVAQTGNNLAYSSQSDSEVDGKQRRGTFFVKMSVQPWENLQYYGAIGIGDSSIEIPSATVRNTFVGDAPGLTYLIGIKSNIFPETEVTPAISADAGFGWTRHYFNRIDQHEAGVRNINARFDCLDYHLGFWVSRHIGETEPYAGLKMTRRTVKLKSIGEGERVGGANDYAAVFLGVKFPVFAKESLVTELSFGDATRFGIGLEIKLK